MKNIITIAIFSFIFSIILSSQTIPLYNVHMIPLIQKDLINIKQTVLVKETEKADITNCPTRCEPNLPFMSFENLTGLDGLSFINPDKGERWKNDFVATDNEKKNVLSKSKEADKKLLLKHDAGLFCLSGFRILEESKILGEADLVNIRTLEVAYKKPSVDNRPLRNFSGEIL